MKWINKKAPPDSFTKFKGKGAGVSFDDIDTEEKVDLKKSLLDEQGWICGYCQQRIFEMKYMTIEHHCEQSICNGSKGTVDKRLDYTNLMGVCLGKTGEVLHCDSKKASFKIGKGLPMHISPWIEAHMNAVKYHSTGLINSVNTIHDSEMNDILNLNTSHLKEQRKKIWQDIYRLSKTKLNIVNKDKMRRLLQLNIEMAGNVYPASFPGLYAYMAKKFC